MKPNGEGPKSPIDRVQRELNKVRSGFENTINIVGETPLGTSVKYVGNVWDDFMNFINRGNVVDLAVGIIMGSAMTSIVNSIVTDIISPFIGLAIGNNLNEAYILLACPTGPNGKRLESCPKYETPKLAAENGAVTWNWGSFVQSVINFFVISLIVFFLVKVTVILT